MVEHRWAIILAGGEGTRLRSLTTDETGAAVPKQYCSFGRRETLLRLALARAASVVPARHVVPVVVRHHARWWEKELADLPQDDVVVAPSNRGTAPGLLLPLLHVLRRDPRAVVLVLPSDHEVVDEARLRGVLEAAFEASAADPEGVVLLGVAPTEPDAGYGWIVPGPPAGGGTARIAAFCEKPSLERARSLMDSGALWNTFMLVGTGTALLDLFAATQADVLEAFAPLCTPGDQPWSPWVVAGVHDALPQRDFSRDVLEHTVGRLRVLRVPPCGWSDMGTPERVARVLARASGGGMLATGATA